MQYLKPAFYAIVALICLYLAYAVYSGNSVESGAGFGLTMTYILAIVAVGASIVFPVIYMISHPKSAVRALIGIGLILVIFGLGWALSGDEILISYEKVGFTSPSASKLVGGALKMMYMVIAVVLGATIYSEVRKLIK
ncbi:MAG: hypothetical protein LPK45_11015 [Bacteroidota bacterium]|nr:hypothetical protein [Bacteroidota bacterium]MDX5431632.1 hypothetical protein [Bacteroidota bacterium]MDX5470350.1 hypothetical protein [Bacteroidota bacterium]